MTSEEMRVAKSAEVRKQTHSSDGLERSVGLGPCRREIGVPDSRACAYFPSH